MLYVQFTAVWHPGAFGRDGGEKGGREGGGGGNPPMHRNFVCNPHESPIQREINENPILKLGRGLCWNKRRQIAIHSRTRGASSHGVHLAVGYLG